MVGCWALAFEKCNTRSLDAFKEIRRNKLRAMFLAGKL